MKQDLSGYQKKKTDRFKNGKSKIIFMTMDSLMFKKIWAILQNKMQKQLGHCV